MSSISLIIPVHRDGPVLQQCFRHLSTLAPAPLELIVVVDGEAEVSLPALPFPVHCYRQPAAGPAQARNLGAREAQGTWLCFIDADVAVPDDFLAQAHALIQAPDQPVAFIGSYDDQPGHPGYCSQYRNLLHHYTHQQASLEASTFWGACGLINRAGFIQVGGFDPRYRRPSVEDIELGYRLRAAGYRIRLVPTWQVCHLKHWTLVDMVRTDIWQRALPWTALLLRYRQLGEYDLNVDWRGRGSGLLCLSLLAALASGQALLGLLLLLLVWTLNVDFYRFLARAHSWQLALVAFPLHLLYFGYSSMAFAWGWASHWFYLRRRGKPTPAMPHSF